MSAAESSSESADSGGGGFEISISVRTILLVAVAAAVAWALASITSVLLTIFISLFNVAVLLPVVSSLERRFRWSRGLSASVLVVATLLLVVVVLLVLALAVADAVRGLSHNLPHILDQVRHSGLGRFLNGGSGWVDTLRKHTNDITKGFGNASRGVAHVGASAAGAVALAISVIFLTFFGLVEEPQLRKRTGSLLYRRERERYFDITDRIVTTTSRYMLGNLAISVICGTVYGITAAILGVPYPLALALIAGILDLVPNIGATIAGIIIAIISLSVSVKAMIIFVIVIVVYQQVENYILQPTIIGKAAAVSGFTVLVSVLAFGALFGLIGGVIAVPLAAGIQIVVEELTAARRARIAAADAADAPAAVEQPGH